MRGIIYPLLLFRTKQLEEKQFIIQKEVTLKEADLVAPIKEMVDRIRTEINQVYCFLHTTAVLISS